MAVPIGLALSLAGGLGGAIFGGRKKHNYSPGKFSFNPDLNDPDLALQRRLALETGSRDRLRTTDEIARAGLLGSGTAFNLLGESEARTQRSLEDTQNSVFGRQRDVALQLFRDQEAFKRQQALMDQQAGIQEHQAGLEGLGGIAEFAGGELEKYINNPLSFADYLKRKKNLPTNELLDASNFEFTPESIYGYTGVPGLRRSNPRLAAL